MKSRLQVLHPANPANCTLESCEVNVVDRSEDLSINVDESYTLNITSMPQMTCQMRAQTVRGALCALESFSQLISSHGTIEALHIADKPRFHFRAIMIDTARHYYPPATILMHLDAMVAVKFNVLH
jgi:hexosaminidase